MENMNYMNSGYSGYSLRMYIIYHTLTRLLLRLLLKYSGYSWAINSVPKSNYISLLFTTRVPESNRKSNQKTYISSLFTTRVPRVTRDI